MSWQPKRLDQLGSVSRGRSRHRPRDAAHLYGGPHPFIQTGDVKHAYVHLSTQLVQQRRLPGSGSSHHRRESYGIKVSVDALFVMRVSDLNLHRMRQREESHLEDGLRRHGSCDNERHGAD